MNPSTSGFKQLSNFCIFIIYEFIFPWCGNVFIFPVKIHQT